MEKTINGVALSSKVTDSNSGETSLFYLFVMPNVTPGAKYQTKWAEC